MVEQARDTIREGESIAATLKKSGQFPSMMCHMVAVGERSGQLESMLENVADAYERDVETKVGAADGAAVAADDRHHGGRGGLHGVLDPGPHHGHAADWFSEQTTRKET